MNAEQVKKERMKIAYNLLQGLTAYEGCSSESYTITSVEWAYQVADEVLKQGGYENE